MKARPALPPISLPPAPDFEHFSDSDDDELEYQLDLGAETPCSNIGEENVPEWMRIERDFAIKPVVEKSCNCGSCIGLPIRMPCCQHSFCSFRLAKAIRQSGRCPSCQSSSNLHEILTPSEELAFDHERESSVSESDEEYDPVQSELAKVAQLPSDATSSVLSRMFGTLALMVFLYALSFRTS
ncbi:hypothetical protein CYLTODRAFT_451008 [Cylindrobasidium torrendii FP15055 ss-10]|uniref:Uncharacterized protein n=1 Tax=Cylindrobasidium torrendii FP15055 ss-10 TaxID=1314674 RepID=A0A0D7BNQ6_9AGAR|nr:hypothetical protein CYLTODRAFT_451008 [Cylindrobasidium torrendii FP15055 ss-10]